MEQWYGIYVASQICSHGGRKRNMWWAVRKEPSSGTAMKVFAAYVQHRWLSALDGLLKGAQPNALKGQQVAVTGEPEELSPLVGVQAMACNMRRTTIESLIKALGGKAC